MIIKYLFPPLFLLCSLSAYAAHDAAKGNIYAIGFLAMSAMLVQRYFRLRKQNNLNSRADEFGSSEPMIPLHQESGRSLRWFLPFMLIFQFGFGLYVSVLAFGRISIFLLIEDLVLTIFLYVVFAKTIRPQIVEIDANTVKFIPLPVIGFLKRHEQTIPISNFFLRLSDSRARGGTGYRLALIGNGKAPSTYLDFPRQVNQLEYAKQLADALNIPLEGLPEMAMPSSASLPFGGNAE